MNTLGILLTSLLIFWLPLFGVGQVDRALDTVEVAAYRLDQLTPGHRKVQLDSLQLAQAQGQNLADLLSLHTDVFIKSYGLGSLATTSLRGGGASHTALVWNGLPMQSPMNGQADLSLIPAFFLDEVQVQYGGSAALFGSGAVGGAIHLGQGGTVASGWGSRWFGQMGSFGNQQTGLEIQYGGQKWFSKSRLFVRMAQNDFRLPGTDRRQTHAALSQSGLLQEVGVQLSPRQQLRFWVWAQQSDRQLPPPLTNLNSTANQEDESLRIMGKWSQQGDRWQVSYQTAYQREFLFYEDSAAAIFSDNLSHTLLQQAEAHWQWHPQHRFQFALQHQYQTAQADGYEDLLPQQHQGAAFASYHWKSISSKWEGIASLRQPLAQAEAISVGPLPSLSFKGQLIPGLQLHAQGGRTFRQPTFNDLYWNPGGNPDLRPETGWHQEMGLLAQVQPKGVLLSAQLTAFHQLIDDWILWRPGPNFWYPENLRSVRSQGLESEVNAKWQLANWSLQFLAAHTYIQATIRQTTLARDASLDKQLIYTPRHQGRSSLTISKGPFSCTYLHRWTGRRYTSSDNSRWLDAFHTGSMMLNWERPFHSFKLPLSHWESSLRVQFDNLWNQSYQIIENRPMPLRSWSVGLEIRPQWNHTKPITK
ncbi:MAG: TonB-dependent receptor [Bacteroidota bacterium]